MHADNKDLHIVLKYAKVCAATKNICPLASLCVGVPGAISALGVVA